MITLIDRPSYLFFVFIAVIPSCVSKNSGEVLSNFEVLERIDRHVESFSSSIITAQGDIIYPRRIKQPIIRLNVKTGEVFNIGNIGSAPGEYNIVAWISEYKGDIYLADKTTGRLLMFSLSGSFKEEVGVYNILTKFTFLNDSLLFTLNPTVEKGIFLSYNIRQKKKSLEFGSSIEYPLARYKTRLSRKGRHTPYVTEWDTKDSILIYYDYYRDRLHVYNLLNGKQIRIFGREHNGWSIPRPFVFKGDEYHRRSWMLPFTPCRGLQITDKYIYIVFYKSWLNGWRNKGFGDDFVLVDVYARDDFSYVGSFFPFKESDHNYQGNKLRLDWVAVEDDSILNFYMIDLKNGNAFRKIKIKFKGVSLHPGP